MNSLDGLTGKRIKISVTVSKRGVEAIRMGWNETGKKHWEWEGGREVHSAVVRERDHCRSSNTLWVLNIAPRNRIGLSVTKDQKPSGLKSPNENLG